MLERIQARLHALRAKLQPPAKLHEPLAQLREPPAQLHEPPAQPGMGKEACASAAFSYSHSYSSSSAAGPYSLSPSTPEGMARWRPSSERPSSPIAFDLGPSRPLPPTPAVASAVADYTGGARGEPPFTDPGVRAPRPERPSPPRSLQRALSRSSLGTSMSSLFNASMDNLRAYIPKPFGGGERGSRGDERGGAGEGKSEAGRRRADDRDVRPRTDAINHTCRVLVTARSARHGSSRGPHPARPQGHGGWISW